MTNNVINLFEEERRIPAKECLAGRVEELDEADTFTDVLVITYGEEGLAIRSNAGGFAEVNLLLDITKSTILTGIIYDDEDEYE